MASSPPASSDELGCGCMSPKPVPHTAAGRAPPTTSVLDPAIISRRPFSFPIPTPVIPLRRHQDVRFIFPGLRSPPSRPPACRPPAVIRHHSHVGGDVASATSPATSALGLTWQADVVGHVTPCHVTKSVTGVTSVTAP